MSNEISNETMRIFNHDINCKKTFTTISRKSLNRDTNNFVKFYA